MTPDSSPRGWLANFSLPWRIGIAGLLFFAFLGLEVATFSDVGEPRYVRDTNVYMRASENPFFSSEFLLSYKPLATVMLYKAAGRDQTAIVHVQSVLSVIAWLALGLAVAAQLRGALIQIATVLALGAFSFLIPVNQWDAILLSESLSLSLLALTIAATLVLVRALIEGRARAPILVVWTAACLLLALARDSNIYLLATLLAILGLWFAGRALAGRRSRGALRVDGRLLVACVGLVLVLAGTYAAMKASVRWHDPLVNVLLRRIVRHADLMDEFATRYAMPRNPEFERYGGRKAWARVDSGRPIRDRFWLRDPEVEDVRQWLVSRGMSSYQRWVLLDHTRDSLLRSFIAFRSQVSSRYIERQYGKGAGHRDWTLALTKWSYRRIEHPMTLLGGVLAVSLALALVPGRQRLLAAVAAFLAANAWAQGFITYHADTSNVPRHMVVCGVLLRLAILLLVLALLDRLLDAAKHRFRGTTRAAQA